MNKKKWLFWERKKILKWAGSLFLAAIFILIATFGLYKEKLPREKQEYPIVVLGDSVIGNRFDGEGIPSYLSRELGVPVLNGGFGGTRASFPAEETYPHSVGSYLSLVKLAEAIACRDFSVQKAQIAYGEHYLNILPETLDYFSNTIKELDRVDYSRVNYMIIEHGTNDYNTGQRLDNPEDPYDVKTYGGALRYSIEALQEAYPDMRLILMSPTWCYIWIDGQRVDSEEADFGGGYLEEYVDLEGKIAEEYGLYFLDNYHNSEVRELTQEQYYFDGLHLNGEGQKKIAEEIAAFIRQIEKNGSVAD